MTIIFFNIFQFYVILVNYQARMNIVEYYWILEAAILQINYDAKIIRKIDVTDIWIIPNDKSLIIPGVEYRWNILSEVVLYIYFRATQ